MCSHKTSLKTLKCFAACCTFIILSYSTSQQILTIFSFMKFNLLHMRSLLVEIITRPFPSIKTWGCFGGNWWTNKIIAQENGRCMSLYKITNASPNDRNRLKYKEHSCPTKPTEPKKHWRQHRICNIIYSHLIDRYIWRTKKSAARKPTVPSMRKNP